jgi:uroporphyrinogen III methyltransferase/synthase
VSPPRPPGTVYLVGAGPGDPDLLTVRGAELLRRADAVVYDALAPKELLDLAPRSALRIGVGRRAHADPPRSQEDVNALLLRLAREGRTVVRLKGGDPFVFGRGGEEASACRAAGIPFEVVPGVSSALGALAYAGIPVTDRRHASSFTVVTGHKDPTASAQSTRWKQIAAGADTLVVLMGMTHLREILARLMEHGRAPKTPAAAVMMGTTTRQRTVVSDLANLADEVERVGLGAPSAVVVGDVVALRSELQWFEARPLFGRRVLVTRPTGQNADLAALLRALGAEAVLVPLVRIAEHDPAPLDAALEKLDDYDAVLLTSRPAARILAARCLGRLSPERRCPDVLCVGEGTAREARRGGLPGRRLPGAAAEAEGMLAALTREDRCRGRRYLFPCAEKARDVLPEGLRAAGAVVDVLHVYATEPAVVDEAWLMGELLGRRLDLLSFASPSEVRSLVGRLGPKAREALQCARIAVIGPVTASAVEAEGLRVDAIAEEASDAGLVRAIVSCLQETREGGVS